MIDPLAEPMAAPIWQVRELTTHIRETLESAPALADLWVQGEVSSSSTSPAGHTYFTLQDGQSRLACVLFRRQSRRVEAPEPGRLYVVRGSISVYEAGGRYQLYVSDARPVGLGELHVQFERLKARLDAEELFDPERKRPLPAWPQRIGIVTSTRGAALHDLCQVIGRRYPVVELVLAPSLVQGLEAPAAIVRALATLEAQAALDLIVVARGGGSAEDLWAFNDERVARAIAAASVPVVSAVGHETDFTIADFVSDVRAPTPSAAAEMVVPDGEALARQLSELQDRVQRSLHAHIGANRAALSAAADDLHRLLRRCLDHTASRLAAAEGRLTALNPLAVLARGYALVRDEATGQVLSRVAAAQEGEVLHVIMADGYLRARVTGVCPTDTADHGVGGEDDAAKQRQPRQR